MQPSSKTPVVVAIITAIGGIIAALVGGYFVMQNTVLQKTLDLTMTAYAREQNASSNVTDTPYPNSTMPPIDIQPPSDTPQPIVVPIDTLEPQNVSIDTDLNSVLSVGETWTTNGLSVQLPSISFRFSDEMNINFIFINNTGKTLFFNFNESTQVTLKDDKGNIYIFGIIFTNKM